MIPYNSRRLPRFSRLFLMVLLTVSSFAQALECEWRYINQWNGGATAELHASNNTSSAITLGSFTAGFSAGVSIQQAWNAAITGSNPYTFTPYEWNADLQPGGSMYVGMQITLPAGEPAEDHIPVLGGECSTGSDPNEPLGSLGISTVEKGTCRLNKKPDGFCFTPLHHAEQAFPECRSIYNFFAQQLHGKQWLRLRLHNGL